MKSPVLLLFSLCACLPGLARQDTLRGKVWDIKRSPVFAANVYLKSNPAGGTISGEDGGFLLKYTPTLPDTLVVSFIGYRTACIPLSSNPKKSPLTVILKENDQELREVVVKANPTLSREFSIERVSRLDIYNTPASAGDPLKMVTTLAASTNTDESAEPALRGSSGDMSRVILNHVPVYRPVRNSRINGPGNFSLFNTEMLASEDVYAGNPPLIYSNATAGLVELRTLAKQPLPLTQAAISLANIGFLRTQPLGRTAFLQVYTNYQFSGPYLGINYNPYVENFRTTDAGLNLHFSNHEGFSFNLFSYVIDENFKSHSYMFTYEGEMNAGKKRNFNILNLEYRFNRTLISLNSGFDFARGNYYFGNIRALQHEQSYYTDLNVKQFISTALYIQGGLSYSYERTAYRGNTPLYPYAIGPDSPYRFTRQVTDKSNPELYLYARWSPSSQLILGGGVRKNITSGSFPSYCSWQGNIRYLQGNHSFLFALGQYHGYSVPDYNLRKYTPVSSRQYSLEYRFQQNGTDLQIATYLKQEKHTVYFDETGYSQPTRYHIAGTEISLSHTWNRLSTSAAYTFLYARQKIQNQWTDAPNRMNYLIKLSLSYTSPIWGRITLFSLLRPGLYYTPVDGGQWVPLANAYRPVYVNYYSARYPTYTTLDVSYNKIFPLKKHYIVIFVSLMNVSDRKNKAYLRYRPDYSASDGYGVYSRRAVYFGLQYNF